MSESQKKQEIGAVGSESSARLGAYFGKDCPVGKVQIEFVGCSPSEKYSEYGWRPVDGAFLEVYVDGERFRIQVGNFCDGRNDRRGLQIIGPMDMKCEKTSVNACSVWREK